MQTPFGGSKFKNVPYLFVHSRHTEGTFYDGKYGELDPRGSGTYSNTFSGFSSGNVYLLANMDQATAPVWGGRRAKEYATADRDMSPSALCMQESASGAFITAWQIPFGHYITTPDLDVGQDFFDSPQFSIECRVYLGSLTSAGTIMCIRRTDGTNFTSPAQVAFAMYLGATGEIQADFGDPSLDYSASSTGVWRSAVTRTNVVTVPGWNHIKVCRYPDNRYIVFVNGQAEVTGTMSSITIGARSDIWFGRRSSGLALYQGMRIEEVRLCTEIDTQSDSFSVPGSAHLYY